MEKEHKPLEVGVDIWKDGDEILVRGVWQPVQPWYIGKKYNESFGDHETRRVVGE